MKIRNVAPSVGVLLLCGNAMAGDPFIAGLVDFTGGYTPPADATGYSMHWSGLSGIPNGTMKKGRNGNQIYLRWNPETRPDAGPLLEGDVILGVGGTMFEGDVIDTWRTALREAREESEDGRLEIMRWRKGTRATISLLVVEPVPDLTRGETEKVDRKGTYNLGPTGMRGWIYTKPRSNLDATQGRTTASSRQILVTHVGARSPADGVMKADDVILGAGGRSFTDDARKSIARAITEAEKEAGRGILRLTRWRAGRTEEVRLRLRVMGTYSDTAPYDCPKSKRILEEACKVLEKEPLEANWCGAANGLALMATGRPEYLPRIREYARKTGPPTLKLDRGAFGTWETGYRTLFLCEYFLLTGDGEVLHAIREFTLALARGQGMYGTFGHGFCDLRPDGGFNGPIPPYGPVNMAGLPANLAIVMGRTCGVGGPEVDAAIERAAGFFGYFVDKGAIPYGEHEPCPMHENNGKNSIAALLFAVQGGRPRAARFFAQSATAAYANRETGHTGQGFSYLWSALGANVGGPAAAAAFVKEASWHLDLVRRSDGSFTYDGGEQHGPGRTEDDTYYGRSGYYGLSPTATYVLTYSLPLRKLLITGRDAEGAHWLSRAEVAAAIASGRFDVDRKGKTADELVAAFRDWSPVVRSWAAQELARRPEARKMVPALVAMSEGADARVRQGACETLGYLKDPSALAVLVRLLRHDDRFLRVKAAKALKNMGEAARPVLTDMLRALIDTAEPIDPIAWDDPIQLTHGHLASAIFDGLLGSSIEGVDKRLLYPAIRAVAGNADGMARSYLADTFAANLTDEDARALAPDIFAALREKAPADTMFGNELPMASASVLSKYHYREGMRAILDYMKRIDFHGSENRVPKLIAMLRSYGAAARGLVPELRELLAEYRKPHVHAWAQKIKADALEEAIGFIETDADPPQLRGFGEQAREAIPGREGIR